ncbi:MAG: hypothetical protein KAG98_05250 [Lentisphaeria bacterium]|nr:hypothetical protein [Lentisphaeria bacterium]
MNIKLKDIILTVIGIAFLFMSNKEIPKLDQIANRYFNDAIVQAGTSYAACRLINGGISVLKESEVGIEPMGVGVTLAVGQILDPLDDMTERLSDVLVTAIASLGVQKLIHSLTVYLSPILLGLFIIIWVLLGFKENETTLRIRRLLVKVSIFVSVARFCLPISGIISDSVYNVVFKDQIIEAKASLPLQNGEIDRLTNMSFTESDGFVETVENTGTLMKEIFIEFRNILGELYLNLQDIILNLTTLTFLYVGLFVIQVILIPICIFIFLSKLVNTMFNTNIPIILSHKELKRPKVCPEVSS